MVGQFTVLRRTKSWPKIKNPLCLGRQHWDSDRKYDMSTFGFGTDVIFLIGAIAGHRAGHNSGLSWYPAGTALVHHPATQSVADQSCCRAGTSFRHAMMAGFVLKDDIYSFGRPYDHLIAPNCRDSHTCNCNSKRTPLQRRVVGVILAGTIRCGAGM